MPELFEFEQRLLEAARRIAAVPAGVGEDPSVQARLTEILRRAYRASHPRYRARLRRAATARLGCPLPARAPA